MIRIAIVGIGQRGQATLERLRYVSQAEIVALCDSRAELKDLACDDVTFYTDWHDVTCRADIHLIYICTPWDSHVDIAVDAMQHGKHVAVEVPAAMTVSDCQLLVRVSHSTGMHCVMLENCCYDTWHLGVKEMVRQGMFGQITHLEGAYIHNVDSRWMHEQRQQHQGNPYPTHGFGPMCQLLDADDAVETLVSMSARNDTSGVNLNDTLFKTKKGVSLLLQYDTSTPRPYNRLQVVCGTKGFAQKYPLPTIQLEGMDEALVGDAAVSYVESCIPEAFQVLIHDGNLQNVNNIMNYIMDRRLIDGIQQGLPHLDMGVHEAALWSSIAELTAQSASQGGEKVVVPRFTGT